jgi:hypothetical protein
MESVVQNPSLSAIRVPRRDRNLARERHAGTVLAQKKMHPDRDGPIPHPQSEHRSPIQFKGGLTLIFLRRQNIYDLRHVDHEDIQVKL